jgi:HSP20 family protein
MAEVDVKKQTPGGSGQTMEHFPQGGLSLRSPFHSLFSLSPAEFLSTSPFTLMRRFTEEMDRVFADFGSSRGSDSVGWSPPIEVSEHAGKFEVIAELPGLRENDIKLEVTEYGLVIQGERRGEHEERCEGYLRSERSYGRFYRLIPLPEGVNVDQAHAEFRNGELRVTLPIPERQRPSREIPISMGGERKQPASQSQRKEQAAKVG